MDCRRYRDALSDVAAGMAPPAGLELHLAACAPCRRQLEALRNAVVMAGRELEQLVAVEPSARFAQRVRAAAARQATAPVQMAPWLWPACAAASAVAIAIITLVPGKSPRVTTQVAREAPSAPAPEKTAATATVDPVSVKPGEVAMVPPAPRPDERRARPAAVEARILVPPGEADALRAFVDSIPPGEHVSGPPAAEADSVTALRAVLPITIRPIEIVPLDPPAHFGT